MTFLIDASGNTCCTTCWGGRGKQIGHEGLERSRKVFLAGGGVQEVFAKRLDSMRSVTLKNESQGKNIPCGKR